jgi:superfamily I DNA/RNA helicase
MSTWWLGESELKEEQREVLEIEPARSFLLLGPPGSGKTNILLLRANYLYLSDYPNLAMIVFTKTLQRFIGTGAERYDFPGSKITTSIKWQRDLLQQHGVSMPRFDAKTSFETQRLRLGELIRSELIEKRKIGPIFDAILLDEAHDYTPEEILDFRALCQVFVASADSRQRIYATQDSLPALQAATNHTVTLQHHYRIGRNVCRVADAIGKGMSDYEPMFSRCQYDEEAYPSKVSSVRSGGIDRQAADVIAAIGLQLEAYPGEMIGVLAARHQEADAVYDALEKSAHASVTLRHDTNGHPQFDRSTRVCVTTIHSAKGLEFRAVHIVDADRLQHKSINLSFTAITRAKTIATLYCSDGLPGFLERGIRETEPARPLPQVESLFGKKGK